MSPMGMPCLMSWVVSQSPYTVQISAWSETKSSKSGSADSSCRCTAMRSSGSAINCTASCTAWYRRRQSSGSRPAQHAHAHARVTIDLLLRSYVISRNLP